MVIVGFEGDRWLPVHDFSEIVRDGNDTCIVVDPRLHLERTLARIKDDFGDDHRISVVRIARLDVANIPAYQTLLAALVDRWAEIWLDMLFIEFERLSVFAYYKRTEARHSTSRRQFLV
jgi:hypothetical protein